MKNIIAIAFFLLAYSANAQKVTKKVVDVACGECKFKMKGDACDLAIRMDGKTYFVEGTKIDEHGDAHAKDGFCNAIRQAEITGEIVGDRFKATSFKLLPPKNQKKGSKTVF